MTARNKPVKKSAAREIVITRVIDAPRKAVFRAWTDPKQIAKWWGPKGFTNPVCEWDARPGGLIYVVMRAPNGVDYPMAGEFREVIVPKSMVFTSGALDEKKKMMFELLHIITFVEEKGKTKLTIRTHIIKSTPGSEKYTDGYEAGMTQSLERLSELVSDTSDREILITRVISAPRERVWEAMTDPKQVVEWWGPNGFTTTIEKMDVRPGGVWKHMMHGPNGTNYPNKSIFIEITKPERIVYAHGGGKKGAPGVNFISTWTFEAQGKNKTKVTMHGVFPSAEERDTVVRVYGAIEGGKQTLGRLEEYVKNQ